MIRNIVIGALVLGFIAVVVFFDIPGVENILNIRKEIDAEKQVFSDNQALSQKVEGLVGVYKNNKESIDKMDNILPPNVDIPDLIVQLEALVFEQGLILDKLEVKIPTEETASSRAEAARTGQVAAAVQKYKIVNIELGFTGDYSALKNFLKATEENMRLIDIDSIGISPEAEASGIFNYDLTLKSYYQ